MRSTKYGGVERYFVELARRCESRGFHLVLQYYEAPRSAQYARDLDAAGALVVVQTPGSRVSIVGRALWLIARRRPGIVHLHFCDGWTRLAVGLCAHLLGVKRVVATAHLMPFAGSGRSRALARVSYTLMDRILCVSDSVRQDLAALGVPQRILTTQYLGVPELGPLSSQVRAEVRAKLAIAPAAPVLVSTLFNSKMKAIDVLVDAFADHLAADFPELHLVIVGVPYADRERFTSRADCCPGRLHWAGITDDVRPFLAAADVYVQPSRREAFGLAIVEAMRQSLPVVATRVGGIPEVVDDEVSGILVEPDSPDELATAVGRILDDGELSRRFAEAGLARWRALFDLGRSVDLLLDEHYDLARRG
jgi:glycosyltransferase involved in cell wall biosynthesis